MGIVRRDRLPRVTAFQGSPACCFQRRERVACENRDEMDTDPAVEKDPVIEAYKPGVDMTLIWENLRLTPDQRVQRLQSVLNSLEEVKRNRHGLEPSGESS